MITPHLRSTLGAVLVGSGAASMFVISFFFPSEIRADYWMVCGLSLTGVVGTQTVYYFQNYPEDKPSIKLMVSLQLLSCRLVHRLSP